MTDNNYIPPKYQKGFLPGVSGCLEHNTLLSECLKDARKNERQITVGWLDLENAYGLVRHELLQFALKWYNIPPDICSIIESYYNHLRFSVVIGGERSQEMVYGKGLFQGCCLSPAAFNVVINILVDTLATHGKKWGYRLKLNGQYTAAILAFADDMTILTRNPKQCQSLLKLVDTFCEWSGGMKIKPSKCYSLCLSRKGTKFTSSDPKLEISGEQINSVPEEVPFKFLGKKFDHLGKTPSLDFVMDDFLSYLQAVDNFPLSGTQKAWIYDNYLTSRLTWPFLIYDFTKTSLIKLDAGVTKYLKSWLGLARPSDPSTLYRSHNNFGLNIKKPSTIYEKSRVTKNCILKNTKDETLRPLVDNDKSQLDGRLNFYRAFQEGIRTTRLGLGAGPKKSDKEILKDFIDEDAEQLYKTHAVNLEMQNDWMILGDFCLPPALEWRAMLYNWSPELLKFYLNAFQMTLPDKANLVRWGKSDDKSCPNCSENICTARHLLVGCKALLDKGLYSHRHDKVLEIIRDAISCTIARVKKDLVCSKKEGIAFVKKGEKVPKRTERPFSILAGTKDWVIYMDTCENHYRIPEEICTTSYRPDILIYSKLAKRVIFVELTVPWETNIPKDHTIKTNKYCDLLDQVTRKGFKAQLYAVEVGARGLPAKSIYDLFKNLGLARRSVSSFMERVSKAALSASHGIFIGWRWEPSALHLTNLESVSS